MKKTIVAWLVFVLLLLNVFACAETVAPPKTQEETWASFQAEHGDLFSEWSAPTLIRLANSLREGAYTPGQTEGLATLAMYTYAVPNCYAELVGVVGVVVDRIKVEYPQMQDVNILCFRPFWFMNGTGGYRVVVTDIEHSLCVYADVDYWNLSMDGGLRLLGAEDAWYAPLVTSDYFVMQDTLQAIWNSDVAGEEFWTPLNAYIADSCWEMRIAENYRDYGAFIPAWPLEGQALNRLMWGNDNYHQHHQVYIDHFLPCERYLPVDEAIEIAVQVFSAAGESERIEGIAPLVSLKSGWIHGVTAYEIAFSRLDEQHQPTDHLGHVIINAETGEIIDVDLVGGFNG